MPYVIQTEAGFVGVESGTFVWRRHAAKRFYNFDQAMRVRAALNTKRATVIKLPKPRVYHGDGGIDIFPEEGEDF